MDVLSQLMNFGSNKVDDAVVSKDTVSVIQSNPSHDISSETTGDADVSSQVRVNDVRLLVDQLNASKAEINRLGARIVELESKNNDIQHSDVGVLVDTVYAYRDENRQLRQQISVLEQRQADNESFAEFGLYEPTYVFATVEGYKAALQTCRSSQKDWMRRFRENLKTSSWKLNGSKAQGRKMIEDVGRLLLRSYNGECDVLISKVTYRNIDTTVKKICSLAESISRYGKLFGISLDKSYINLKIQEAYLAYDFAQFKANERERIREEKQRAREERKAQAEIAAKRKELEKEKIQYVKAAEDLREQLKKAKEDSDENVDVLAVKEKLQHVEEQLDDVDEALEDVDYRDANKRAGYVYVISNVGSFGPHVYKIGMTRRLDPYERIRELSSASVPFSFDVHAMIFADDAPALEAALHREFADRRINLINGRKEFFSATLKEIEAVILSNYDGTVEFVDDIDADQWRQSRAMRQKKGNNIRLDLVN